MCAIYKGDFSTVVVPREFVYFSMVIRNGYKKKTLAIYFKVISQNLSRDLEANKRKPSVSIIGLSLES
jgi:hypothetical protein